MSKSTRFLLWLSLTVLIYLFAHRLDAALASVVAR